MVVDRIGGGDFESWARDDLDLASGPVPLAIADGLGGHRAGEVASHFSLRELKARAAEIDFEDGRAVSELLNDISRGLHERMREDPALLGMGSTIVVASITSRSVIFVNVGDSRGYFCDASGFRQITHDDVLQRPTMPTQSRRSGAITQALGGAATRTRVVPHIHRVDLPIGQWSIVLCSDGISDFIPEEKIESALRDGSIDARDLINKALEAGGQDNISAIIARFGLAP
ncbi:serine/threonine-protein phosphatase [Rhizobium leguminosarum]|uniref:Serine/threonine-protein phosphatase n=1 Tax=Rhizobium leguminosarum TaxID=384 RepID=A0A6P0AYB4_RHILE|nr:protein phosphatase 2C domain-containing protein [Rhizobium leguminosarum]MBY5487103.1 serine/threonine-protein phosphatase [Rhizobium leguminosarum]NEI32553.1 serine/threonine-protein phosphatase [Rhizobium leguminosarum]NEI39312.1 serine/threonine-protein phosphatase [Rhizobium leguminosarum]